MKKVEIIKEMEGNNIDIQECIKGLLGIGVIHDSEDIDDIMYYLYHKLDEEESFIKLHYWSTELDEVYNRDYNCWSWLYESITVLYDIGENVFVFIHENELREEKELVVKKAPGWFKAGWEGLTAKTLSEEEFNNYYCRLRNNNCFKKVSFGLESGELKGNYFKLKAVKSRIKDFLEANPQMVPTITKDVAV